MGSQLHIWLNGLFPWPQKREGRTRTVPNSLTSRIRIRNAGLLRIRKKYLRIHVLMITCSTPKRRSCLSFSETAGRSVSVPGRLQPFRLPRFPPFSTIPMTKSSPISCTGWITHIYIHSPNNRFLGEPTQVADSDSERFFESEISQAGSELFKVFLFSKIYWVYKFTKNSTFALSFFIIAR